MRDRIDLLFCSDKGCSEKTELWKWYLMFITVFLSLKEVREGKIIHLPENIFSYFQVTLYFVEDVTVKPDNLKLFILSHPQQTFKNWAWVSAQAACWLIFYTGYTTSPDYILGVLCYCVHTFSADLPKLVQEQQLNHKVRNDMGNLQYLSQLIWMKKGEAFWWSSLSSVL